MVDFERSYVKYNDRSIPTIIFNNCNELELVLGDWLGNDKPVGEYMGLLMYKLGVLSDENDVVCLENFNKNDCSLICTINANDVYTIRFKNLNLAGFNPEIVLSNNNIRRSYTCVPHSSSELGMRVVESSCSVYEDGVCFTRYLSTDSAVFAIENKNYILEFGVSKPKHIVLPLFNNGRYSSYKIDNEEELVSYLTSLKFPISILDVYKYICEISIGDVNMYPRMLLKLSKIDCVGSKKITDIIHLENGELENFGMTVGNSCKTLFLNKDGSWSYEMEENDSLVKISSSDDQKKINYNICVNSSDGLDDVKTLIEYNVREAKEDISKAKILVRKMFGSER